MNLPNKITVLRVVLIPFFIVCMMLTFPFSKWIALAIFVVASVTDFIDGYLARSMNLVTNFGKFMDPLADKMLVTSAMILFVATKEIPAWIVIVIIAREFAISGFRLLAAEKGVVIAASWWGKIKTATTMVMLIVLMFNNAAAISGTVITVIEQILIYASLIFTVFSLVDYMVKNIHVIKEGSEA